MSHSCVCTVAGLAVRSDNALATRREYHPFPLPPTTKHYENNSPRIISRDSRGIWRPPTPQEERCFRRVARRNRNLSQNN